MNLQFQPFVLGDMTERVLHIPGQFHELHFGRFNLHRARFDLGKVQDVIDQFKQIVA